MNDDLISRAARRIGSSDIRDLLRHAQQPGMISLAGGLPAAELFDAEGLRAAAALALAEPAAALQYGATEGDASLREQLAQRMLQRGCAVAASDVVVTAGSQQALYLLAQALLDAGDTVALERPSYLAAIQAFALTGARLVSVPGDAQGLVVDALIERAGTARPKLVYLVSNFANPTGACLSLERRRQLLRWAAAERVFVLEDDPYGELRYRGEALPSLLALARDIPGAQAYCGYVSSLSKTVAPGLRVGWMVLPPALREATARIKQALDLHTSTLTQAVAARYLASGRLAEHVERVRADYQRRCAALADALRARFGSSIEFSEPEGGMFLWARLRSGVDTRRLLEAARQRGVIFVPGETFYPDVPERATLRLNFTAGTPAQLAEGAARLFAAHEELLNAAQSVGNSCAMARG